MNFFDHADVYGGGQSEAKFAEALDMTPRLRETMLLQTKCGIRKGAFDFSKEHILEAVDGSLKRLRTDYLDVLLLHRRMRWSSRKKSPKPSPSSRTAARCGISASAIRTRCRLNC